MSVVETPITERVPRNPRQQLTINSFIGAVILLAGLWLVFGGLPMAWTMFWEGFWVRARGFERNEFLSTALLILLDLGAVAGLTYGAYVALQKHTLRGLRAGIFTAALFLFLTLWIGFWIGDLMGDQFSDNKPLGAIVVGFIMAVMLAGIGYLFLMVPGWTQLLETIEEQGWFHATPYKGNQGVRVRRGTIMGILCVGMCGIITLVWNHSFGSIPVTANDPDVFKWLVSSSADGWIVVPFTNDWYIIVPFTEQTTLIPLMFQVHLLLPLVLGVLLIWFAWRVVNIPTFADFLIATEAEMNKVSWTSRKRLVQDTIVVLTTVFLFTGFLFVVDMIWIRVLSWQYIQVLLYDPKLREQEKLKQAEW